MGAEMSTDRMRTLTDMGFSVAEARMALDRTGGDLQQAAEYLAQRRERQQAAAGGPVAFRINELLREQKPWDEFFDRFLWPEHLSDRVQTNLLCVVFFFASICSQEQLCARRYYRANYAIICACVCIVSVLMQPALLIVTAIVAAVLFAAVEWGDRPVPLLEQPLQIEQRLTAAALTSAALVQFSGSAGQLARVATLCGGLTLGHATFRARTLAARWSFFKDQVAKEE